jgi:hypothetical protein
MPSTSSQIAVKGRSVVVSPEVDDNTENAPRLCPVVPEKMSVQNIILSTLQHSGQFLATPLPRGNSVATTRVFLAFLASRETSRGTFLTSSGTLRGGILVKTQKKTEKNSDP